MPKIIAVVSQKGGVGKTSLVQNLAYELASMGRSTLMVDFDPQSSLTYGWGSDPFEQVDTIYTALLDPKKTQTVIQQVRPNLDLIPSSLDLSGAELRFAGDVDRNLKLADALEPVQPRYDYIFVDTPPSLGFYTVNAMMAATDIYLPLQCETFAYKALDQLEIVLAKVARFRPVAITGVVLTQYDGRKNLTQAVAGAARERFEGDVLFDTVIPDNVRVAEAPIDGKPVREYDPVRVAGALAYQELAREVMKRGQG